MIYTKAKMKTSNLRFIALNILNKNPLSGYYLIKKIHNLTNLKPSTGSIYPLLIKLNKEGILKIIIKGRSKIYSLTEKGKKGLSKLDCTKEEYIQTILGQCNICSILLSKKELESLKNDLIERLKYQ